MWLIKIVNPKHELFEKVFPAKAYSKYGVTCDTENGECMLLDGEYEGISEDKIEVNSLPFSAAASIDDEGNYFVHYIPADSATLDKIEAAGGKEAMSKQLGDYLQSQFGITGTYNAEHPAAGYTFILSKEDYAKIPYYKVSEKFTPKGEKIKDKPGFEAKMKQIGDFETKPNPDNSAITDYIHKETGKVIGNWHTTELHGTVLNDELNETVSASTVANKLATGSTFDTSMLRLSYLFLYKNDPYAYSDDELKDKIVDYFIKNQNDDKAFNMIFKSNESLSENSTFVDKAEYFGVLDFFDKGNLMIESIANQVKFLKDLGYTGTLSVNEALGQKFALTESIASLLRGNKMSFTELVNKRLTKA